jgi:hypothetical protein
MQLTVTASSYSGTSSTVTVPAKPAPGQSAAQRSAAPDSSSAPLDFPKKPDGSPDFKKMTAAQKVAFSRGRIKTDLANASGNGGVKTAVLPKRT